ncbi:MAG: hypothetical protein ABIS59_04415 [Candidatus Saccharibacteria bacterium]
MVLEAHSTQAKSYTESAPKFIAPSRLRAITSGKSQIVTEALIFFGFMAVAEGFGAIQYVLAPVYTATIIVIGSLSLLLGLTRLVRKFISR